ncbi:CASP8 and FADD-like apoptosis regulator isoform X3 [Cynoglossus semilaevis]|uniref:CASP8 and FADD-like apoptosis regulator isoform X3 n=1 Tax=Cynoglossus semilaevis TaxID=244447 RepID=UPI000D623618|nr:CASP8 and FADD-like apoptosis regulator isoform X3 [Cynoglossus semilaevis]
MILPHCNGAAEPQSDPIGQMERNSVNTSVAMAYPDHQYLLVINQIAESLDSSERRRVFYLCESPDADDSMPCVKETLTSKVMCYESGYLFLEELLLELKRFDILKKVCGLSREEVAMTLEGSQVLPRFRVLMDCLSEDMASEDLSTMKFLMSRTIPGEKMEKAKTFLDLAVELEKQDLVSPERVDLLEECLKNAGRVDLARKVAAYKTSAVTTPGHSSPQQARCRAPFPLSTPTISPLLRQRGQEQLLHNVTRNPPSRVLRGASCQRQQDQYSFSSNPRGVCVIVDCVGKDGDMLEQTFKTLRFNVILYKWLNAEEIFSTLRDISKQRENLKGDGLVCCIISRASEKRLLGVDLCTSLHLNRIRHLFTADACPLLAGKPKLFFIKTYNVAVFQPRTRTEYRDEDLQTDGCNGPLRYECIPTEADVFWSHCWTDEYQLQDERHCSIYLKALTDALLKGQKWKTKLLDIHTEVNGAIFEHNKRNPAESYSIDLKHTLRKDLYF